MPVLPNFLFHPFEQLRGIFVGTAGSTIHFVDCFELSKVQFAVVIIEDGFRIPLRSTRVGFNFFAK